MQFRDPCKNCLVKAICKVPCDDKQEYWNTRVYIVDLIINSSIAVAILILLFGFVRIRLL